MTISSGGFNLPSPSFSPTPTVFEQETTARLNLQKKAEIGQGNVLIVPQSEASDVNFVNQNKRNTEKYKSDSGRPSLKSVGQQRLNAPELSSKDIGWQKTFNSLVDSVEDPDLQAEIQQPTLPETEALREVFEAGARGVLWLNSAAAGLEMDSAKAKAAENKQLVFQGFHEARSQGKEIASSVNETLDSVGPNFPEYDETKELSTNYQALIGETDDDQNS